MKYYILLFVLFSFTLSNIAQNSSNLVYPSGRNIDVTVKSIVKNTNNRFDYSFTVISKSTSIQQVSEFYIRLGDNIDSVKNPYKWLSGKSYIWKDILMWSARDSNNYILPGKFLSDFSFLSDGLPSIQYYYCVGHFEIPYVNEGEAPDESEIVGGGILENSVKGYTITPNDITTPFISMNFIDTIKTYCDSSFSLGWITDEQTRDKYNNYLNNAKNYLNQNNNNAAKSELQKVITDCNSDSSSVLTSEAYALLYFNTDYLITQLPYSEPGLPVKLIDSQGSLLQDGSLQYYDSGWQEAIDNGNGTFLVQTERATVSLKMTYAGGSQQINNVTVGSDTAVFQTVNTTVKLLNSQNTPFEESTVKYYANGWKDLGTTVNGVATKELLPRNYSFRMSYAGASIDKQQGIDTSATVVFQTVNTTVQLKDSQGNLLDGGTVKYYASGWKDFGVATNGEVAKELLPKNYSLRMSYVGASIDKQQNIGDDSVIVFQTVNATVQLKDSQSNLLDGGTIKYYASGWKDFGTATNGEATKELLPRNYSFRMTYENISNDKQQDISSNSLVEFSTILVTVNAKDGTDNPITNAEVQYYSQGWQIIGNTNAVGEITIEMLPKNITFRVKYNSQTIDKQQDTSENGLVEFIVE